MSEPSFKVIGISDSHRLSLSPEAAVSVSGAEVFSGGRRHYELVRDILPEGHEWIDVTVPLSGVFERYRGRDHIVVFASGDPLFFGYAATLRREFPESRIEVIPTFSSLQTLAHRMTLPYQDMVNVSLTGRQWLNLDAPLIEGRELIGVLTDRVRTPREAAARMLRYGYDNYEMTVGENLGNESRERVRSMSLAEAASTVFEMPNCFILRRTYRRKRYFGIPEDEFFHLEGRSRMITKMPARLLTLSMLDLHGRSSLWDIGYCTGSVSIEARLAFPRMAVTAFEIREESADLMRRNSEKFGAPSITALTGDFLSLDLSDCPRPDAVFIGGHGGRLDEMIGRVAEYLLPGGTVVFNSVSPGSCAMFVESVARHGLRLTGSHRLTLDDYNPLTIMKAE